MLNNEVRKLFKKGKLYEKEWKMYTIIRYEHPYIKMEWIFRKNDKSEKYKMHDLIFNLFFSYEYDWKPMSSRKLGYLLGCDHKTIIAIQKKAEEKMKRPEVNPDYVNIPQNI